MRTPFLITLLGLSLVACAGQIDDGAGGDDDAPETCGDGTVQAGEQCDDANSLDGDGCSAACTTELNPRLTTAVDKPTVSTELGKTETLTLSLTSVDGFVGNVGVVASVVDAANAPIPGITITGPTTLSVPANGVVPGQYTLVVATNATGTQVTGTVKLDLTLPSGTESLTSALTLAPIYTVTYRSTTDANAATHPIQAGQQAATVTVKRGAIIRYKNESTIQHATHGDGIFDHEDIANGGQPNGTYEQTTIQAPPGSTGRLGCHNHGGDNGYVVFTAE